MEIEYREIPGYEGIYEAGSDGSIWSCDGKVTHRTLASGEIQTRVWKRRKLKPKRQLRNSKKNLKDKHYDLRVNLWDKDGNESTKLVSRLVASAFHQNPEDYPCVNHIDGNTENNTPENLEWCSWEYNNKHAVANGLNKEHTNVSLIKNDRYYDFSSLAEASEWLGYNKGYVSAMLIKGISSIDGYQIKTITKIITPARINTKIHHNKKHNKQVALVEDNGTTHYFNSYSQASNWLGKCNAFINSRIKNGNMDVRNFRIVPF